MLPLQLSSETIKLALKIIIPAIILFGIYFYFTTRYNALEEQYDKLVIKYNTQAKELSNVEGNYNTCRTAIDTSNKKYDKLKADYNKSVTEFNNWKKRPPKIKYKYVYKTITKDVNVTRDDCEDVRNVIGNVRLLFDSRSL